MFKGIDMPLVPALSRSTLKGPWSARAQLNYARLEGPWYRPDEVFTADTHGWPGDWEGRIILGLVSQARHTGRTPAWLDEILYRLPRHLNTRGFLGPLLCKGLVHEQQIAGHSWLLRGLIETWRYTANPAILELIEPIIANLLLPAKENYRHYPLNNKEMVRERKNRSWWELSHFQTKLDTHAETVDTGCAFIMIDGATEAFATFGTPALESICRVMIDRFSRIDWVDAGMQTHATLTATRGILRFYESTGEKAYLDLAKKIFLLYKKEAWTAHFANYNWFGRPQWTESCAVIDSWICAQWLFRLTKESSWIDDAHAILYNGVAHGFRANGSFGTDTCAGADGVVCAPKTYEVYWCCTMRGGEFFGRLAENCWYRDQSTLTMANHIDNETTFAGDNESLTLSTVTQYPFTGKTTVRVDASTMVHPVKLRFFITRRADTKRVRITVNGRRTAAAVDRGFATLATTLRPGDTVTVYFPLVLRREKSINSHNDAAPWSWFHGPLLLGTTTVPTHSSTTMKLHHTGKGRYRIDGERLRLQPLYASYSYTTEHQERIVVFP